MKRTDELGIEWTSFEVQTPWGPVPAEYHQQGTAVTWRLLDHETTATTQWDDRPNQSTT